MNLHAPLPPADAADIRSALDRVAASADFRSSPQLVAFLRFIVETTLRGDAARIKAYCIGTDALGRDPSFDPQRDPIVRVEANRLRRALAAYYAGSGANDPIIIDIPPGRYVPTFRLRADGALSDAPSGPTNTHRPPRLLIAGATLLALVLVLAAIAASLRWSGLANIGAEPAAVQVGSLAGAPIIVLERIAAVPAATSSLAERLNDELAQAMATFPAITTVSGSSASQARDMAGARIAVSPVYRLTGLAEALADGRADVTLQLVTNGVVAWTRDWRIDHMSGDDAGTIAREAATELVSLFGVIHARLRTQSTDLAPGFRCLLASADYMRKFDMTQHERVRNCLEQTVAEDPRIATAFAMLAFIYEREYFLDLPTRPGEAPPLERTIQAAQRALALSPDNAVSQIAMMESHYLRGELTAAFAAGEKALALNPLDPAVAGVVGVRLALGGETDRGAALLEKAAARYGVRPVWLDFGLFCLAYLKGDMKAAAHHANLQVADRYPFGMVARALVAAANGDRARAQRVLIRLAALYPGWSEPKKMLKRFIQSNDIVDRLAHDIEAIDAP